MQTPRRTLLRDYRTWNKATSFCWWADFMACAIHLPLKDNSSDVTGNHIPFPQRIFLLWPVETLSGNFMNGFERHEPVVMASSQIDDTTPLLRQRVSTEQYSVFTGVQKQLIIVTAALASSFSPLSANIYYPALNALAKDLGVSSSQINLTITSYMVHYHSPVTTVVSIINETLMF